MSYQPKHRKPSTVGICAEDFKLLTESVSRLANTVDKLSARILGDESMKTGGLIGDVDTFKSETSTNISEIGKYIKSNTEAMSKVQEKIGLLEKFVQEQAEANKSFRTTQDEIKTAKTYALGGWKMLTMVGTACSVLGGVASWAIDKVFTK